VLILTLCAAVLGSAINIPFRYGSLQAESLLANYEKLRTAGKVKPDAATSDQRPATSDQRPATSDQRNAAKPGQLNMHDALRDSVEPNIALQDILIAARSEILRRTQ
jgi:hypothetical protein